MTPFEEAGYTKDTKFKVLRNYGAHVKVGDIVTLDVDDDTIFPDFITEDGRGCSMCLPGMSLYGIEDLEVYEEPTKELTPFEKAGYTKDTKFKVSRGLGYYIKKGEIVTLHRDNGKGYPYFKTEDDRVRCMCLPGMSPKGCDERLEVYEESEYSQLNKEYIVITKTLKPNGINLKFYIKKDIAVLRGLTENSNTFLLRMSSTYIVEDGKLVKSRTDVNTLLCDYLDIK